jgi:succinoglycan biosynthesis transport protein ExoP
MKQQSEARLHALDYWQVIRNRYGVILLSFSLVFLTAAVVTAIMPKKYSGRVLLEVERFSGVSGESFSDKNAQSKAVVGQNTFLPTEFKIISSKESLTRVVKKLGLVDRWKVSNIDEACIKLEKMLDADEERGTDLIRIEVLSTDKAEAKELAEEVANAYIERRKKLEQERVDLALVSLTQSRKGQELLVEKARSKMLELVEQLQIVDLNPTGFGGMRSGTEGDMSKDSIYQNAMQMELQTKKDMSDYKSQLASIKDKDDEELIGAAANLNIMDPRSSTIFSAYLADQIKVRQMAEMGAGPNHPDMLALKAGIDSQKKQLTEGAKSIRNALQDKLKNAEAVLANIQTITKESKDASIDARSAYAKYHEAKEDHMLQQEILQSMVAEQERARLVNLMPRSPATFHEHATEPYHYSKPNAKLQLGLGAVLGLILGLGFAFFLEYLDTSVKTLDDVERYLGVPVLAVIPKDVGILHKQSGVSPDAEAYRILRTNIEFNRKSADANAITIVSGGAGEGKSTTLVNLAYICAQGGYNTLMIDADLRRPKLHTFFDINNSVGLTNYLTTDLQLEDVILQTPIDNLYFMPSGILPADAAGILNSRRMSELIADVKNRFDLVLVDSPPILGVSDASVLASEVDLTMIVIQHRKLPRSMLLRVKQAIENVGGNLLGVVLNNVDVRSDSQYQYYTSYYTYYSPTNTDAKAKSRPSVKSNDPSKASKSTSVASTPKGPAKPTSSNIDDDQY